MIQIDPVEDATVVGSDKAGGANTLLAFVVSPIIYEPYYFPKKVIESFY
jgi:hypothetical protein